MKLTGNKLDIEQGWLRVKGSGMYAGNVCKRTVWDWITKKGLRHTKIGGVTLIKKEWLDEFLENFEVAKDNGNEVDKIVSEVCKDLKQ